MIHRYISTYCVHDLHSDCRLTCKTCRAPCPCECHDRTPETCERCGRPLKAPEHVEVKYLGPREREWVCTAPERTMRGDTL